MGKHLGTQETLDLKKYEKDLKEIHSKRDKERKVMKKKLEKKGYDFQRDWEKLEKKLQGKELNDKDIYLKSICLKIAPMVSGAAIQIRSAFEQKIPDNLKMEIYKDLPSTVNITHGILALLEPEIKQLYKDLKKYYE